MNREDKHLTRIFILALALTLVFGLLQVRVPLGQDDEIGMDLVSHGSGAKPQVRLTVTKDNPQEGNDYWSLYITVEENSGEGWNKTDRVITSELIRMNGTEEEVILEGTGLDGPGFVYMNISYELDDGNYTIRAGVEVEGTMYWDESEVTVPIFSRPPRAIAMLVHNGTRVKEADIYLDRNSEASIILDASESWEPDEGETEFLNFTWIINDTQVTTQKKEITWTFTQPGDYNVTLIAFDPSNMSTEDWVTVHVIEVLYLPDLQVTIEGDKERLEVGDQVLVTATILNNGNIDTWGFDIYFYDWVDNAYSLFKFEHIGLIPMGMTRTMTFYYTPTIVDDHRIQAVVDFIDEIEESNEDNNDASFDITVDPEVLPSATIEIFKYDGSLKVDERTYISIVILNDGTKDVYNVQAFLFIDGSSMVNETIDRLAKGERASIVYIWTPKSEGFYTAHTELWVNNTVHDNKYLNDMHVEERSNDDDSEQDILPIIVIGGTAGLILVVLLVTIAYLGVDNTKYRLFGSVLVAPLYTRLKKEDALNHDLRAKVYDHIVNNPGISYASILKALDLKNGTLVHHLRTLERGRYIKSKKDGKYKRFYPWGTKVGERDPNFLTKIQNQIMEIILSHPGVSQARIANLMGKSRQSINYQIKVLTDAGLINVVKHGISTRCYIMET
jgi:predicted transcriptional regulator